VLVQAHTIVAVTTPKTADDWASVESREDFLTLLELLAANWDAAEAERSARQERGLWAGESGDWAHSTPGAWLEAMHAWLTAALTGEDAERFEANLEPPSWRTFAFILSASRFYE
jgi:hypothetical protein